LSGHYSISVTFVK